MTASPPLAALFTDRRNLFLFLAGYLGLHLAMRLLLSPTLQVDDAEQVVLAQVLAGGYNFQPPLYTWLALALFPLFGPGLVALSVLKYALVALLFWFTWLSARLLFDDRRYAALATLAYLLLYHFAWGMHQGFTHTLLLSTAIAATLYATLRIRHRPSARGFLLLGLAVGAGALSKYSYLVFIAALGLAALATPAFRRTLLERRLWLSVAVAAAVVAPHVFWLATHTAELGFYFETSSIGETTTPGLADRLRAFGELLLAMLLFASPLWLVYLACLPGALRRLPAQAAADDGLALITRFHAAVLFIGAASAALLPLDHYKERWMHPLMLLFPLLYLKRAALAGAGRRGVEWLLRVTLALTLLVVVIRGLQMTVAPRLGDFNRNTMPVLEVAAQIPEPLLRDATVVTVNNFVGGHVHLAHPQAPVHTLQIGGFYPPGSRQRQRYLLVWEPRADETDVHPDLQRFAREELGCAPPRAALGTASAPYPGTTRRYRLAWALVERPPVATTGAAQSASVSTYSAPQ